MMYKTVNFSKLDSRKLFKMHISSASSVVCAKMQEFQCWGTSKVLHYAQLKFDFSDNFIRFPSKTAAKISQSPVMLALQKIHHQRNFGAFRFELLLLGEISTVLIDGTPMFRKICKT